MNGQVSLHMFNIAVYAGRKAQELSKYSRLNPCQRSVLEAAFIKSIYINQTTRKQLAQKTDLSEQTVNQWFRHERYRTRHGRKEKAINTSELYWASFNAFNSLLFILYTDIYI